MRRYVPASTFCGWNIDATPTLVVYASTRRGSLGSAPVVSTSKRVNMPVEPAVALGDLLWQDVPQFEWRKASALWLVVSPGMTGLAAGGFEKRFCERSVFK